MAVAALRHALNVIIHSSKTVDGNASSPAASAAAQHPFSNHLSGGTIQRASRSACACDSRADAPVLYRVRRANAHEWHFDRTWLLLDASRSTEPRGHSADCRTFIHAARIDYELRRMLHRSIQLPHDENVSDIARCQPYTSSYSPGHALARASGWSSPNKEVDR